MTEDILHYAVYFQRSSKIELVTVTMLFIIDSRKMHLKSATRREAELRKG